MSGGSEAPPEPPQAMLRIVNADATAEEIAAIVVVFAALGDPETPAPTRHPEWNTPARMVRPMLHPGPGGWRSSGLPR